MPVTAPARPKVKPQTADGAEAVETPTKIGADQETPAPVTAEQTAEISDNAEAVETAFKSEARARKTEKAKKTETAKAKVKPQVKTDTTNGSEAAETVIKIGAKMTKNAFKEGTESLQKGFEKVTQDCEQMVKFQKDTAEALIESAKIAGKGMETINKAVLEYSRSSIEGGMAATNAVMASKSLQAAVEHQATFTKAAFENYIAEMNKLRELALGTAKAASEPVQKQVDAIASLVKSKTA